MDTETFTIELAQPVDYFRGALRRPDIARIGHRRAAATGDYNGTDPARRLGTAMANCLAATLLLPLRKFRIDMEPLRAGAAVAVLRNAHNRLRIGRIGVDPHLARPAMGDERMRRVLGQFKNFCIVTQSLRACIPTDVRVIDRNGAVPKRPQTIGETA